MSNIQVTDYVYWSTSSGPYSDTRLNIGCWNGWQYTTSRCTIPQSSDVRRVTSVTFAYRPYALLDDHNNPDHCVDLVLQISDNDSQFINVCGPQGSSTGRVNFRLYGKNIGEWTEEIYTATFPEPIILDKNKTYYLWGYPGTNSISRFSFHGTSFQCDYDTQVAASTINVSNTLYMNSNSTISWTPYVSGCTYKVSYKFTSSGTTTVINNSVSGSSVSYTFPTSLSSLIPDRVSGTLTIYVDTYNGNTLIGQTSSDFSLSIPTSGRAPTCASGWASASYTQVISRCIAGRSDIKATVDKSKITTNYNATIQSIWATCNAASQNFTESGTKTLTKAISGSNVVTVTVADSRGITTSTSFTITGEAYSPPSFSSLSVIRCNSSATESSSGTYYAVTPNVTFNSFSGDNTLTIRTRWKISGGSYSAYTTVSNGVKSSALGEGHILTDSSYIVEVYAYDTVGGSSTQTRTLTNTSVAATINLKSNGLGVCIGGYATQDKCFEIKNSEGWKSIISTGMYGSSLPSSGVEGQIFFKEYRGPIITPDQNTEIPATFTVSNCLNFSKNHINNIYVWARWGAATYTPTAADGFWTYTLYTTNSQSTSYTYFTARNNNNNETGGEYIAQANGTWRRIVASTINGYDKSGVIGFPAGITTPSWTQYWRQVGPIVSFNIDATNSSGSELNADALLATGFPAPRTD